MLKSKLWNIIIYYILYIIYIISAIEYYHFSAITAHHQSQSQKHWFLIDKPFENRVGIKLVRTVHFCNACVASKCLEL